ncbi:MAG: restriction endonuclease subunit S [Rhizobacter sp.]
MEHVEAHTMRLLGTAEAASMKSSANRFFPGDVLYGRLRPYLNKVYLATFEGICSPEFIVLPRTAGLSPEFLRYRLNSHDFVAFAKHLNAGDRPRVDFDQISEFEILLPGEERQSQVVAYLDEQLSRLDASVAALHRVQANLKRYRASVLKAACEGRLVPTEAELARQEFREFETGEKLLQHLLAKRRTSQSERKFKEPASPVTDALPKLPDGWHWATMPQVGELNRGKSKHRPRDDELLYGGPYPFVQTGDVRYADGILSRHSQTYSELGLQQSRLWPAGTLCITIAANIAETARLAYPACFPDSIVGFVCDGGEVMTKWIQMFLATAKEHLETFAPGTAQKNINLDVLQNTAIPLPPLAEQHRIVAEADRRLSLIRTAEAQVAANLARAQRLRQSILQAAFAAPAATT